MFLRVLLWSLGGLVVVLVGSFFLAQPEKRDAPDVQDVIRLFDRIAFASGEGRDTHLPYIRRWTQPVRVAVIGMPETEGAVSWADGVRRMTLLYDGLPNVQVSLVASTKFELDSPAVTSAREASNFGIVMVPPEAVQDFADEAGLPPVAVGALAGRAGCVVLGAEAPVLTSVLIAIRNDLSESRRSICLGEGMAKGMGFFISAKWAGEVFRERQQSLAFHPLGRLAAALVYDPAMEPGMEREAALAEARRVLETRGLSAQPAEGDDGRS